MTGICLQCRWDRRCRWIRQCRLCSRTYRHFHRAQADNRQSVLKTRGNVNHCHSRPWLRHNTLLTHPQWLEGSWLNLCLLSYVSGSGSGSVYVINYRAFYNTIIIMLCCLHASVYVCVFRENYGEIAPCSDWSVNFPDTDAYTCHTMHWPRLQWDTWFSMHVVFPHMRARSNGLE